jgi:hypothetical protein
MKMTNKDGKEFSCSKHEIDYRICCEECQDKWKLFIKMCDEAKK